MTAGYDLARAKKDPDAWWTVLVVDPLAMRVLPLLVERQRITPDGLSMTSLVVALLAGSAFLSDHLLLGAVLFELHFVIDCLDGKLARVRGLQSPRGGFVDLACDLLGTAWCFATLGHVVFAGSAHPTLALLAAVAYVTYTWSTVQRSKAGALEVHAAPAGGWLARHRMGRIPYGVEVESLVLFLVPLTGRDELVRPALYFATAFFAMAAARNLRATHRTLPASTSRR